jgi:short-subunit dehydrogenase
MAESLGALVDPAAGRGIGRQTAETLAERGYPLAAPARTSSDLAGGPALRAALETPA